MAYHNSFAVATFVRVDERKVGENVYLNYGFKFSSTSDFVTFLSFSDSCSVGPEDLVKGERYCLRIQERYNQKSKSGSTYSAPFVMDCFPVSDAVSKFSSFYSLE